MKANVLVRLKTEVKDPQGEAVKGGLERLGVRGVKSVRIGKLIEIEMDASLDEATRRAELKRAADELLANPVTESYEVELA